MKSVIYSSFEEIWLVDFEFTTALGNRQIPVCLVAREMRSKRLVRVWQDELNKMKYPPYSINRNVLFVAYYASAEFGCHLSLDWPLPFHVLDLYAEFRNLTNGRRLKCGAGLLGALVWYGLDGLEAAEKDSIRNLILSGGPWNNQEKRSILDYCESDVLSLNKLLVVMDSHIDSPRSLVRGEYMKAAARIEFTGVPIDIDTFNKLNRHWEQIQLLLIREIDFDYNVFENRTFKEERFARYLNRKRIPWPKLDSGKFDLKDETFKEMALSFPEIEPLRQLRITLSQMRLSNLSIGIDGRNRCLLSAFRSRTGRNQPSNSKFIFGPSVWLRSLIKPAPGFGLAYIDWSQQEFAIAAILSGDQKMIEAYESGDPYLAFGIQAGALPRDATKKSYGQEREQFKACVLAVQYGMGERSLARKINQPLAKARDLLVRHRQTYRKFWRWSDSVVDHAMLYGKLWTTFGWTIHTDTNPNPRFLRNFPMQANGSEMLRIACCKAIQRGVRVCAPVHDAMLIEAPIDDLDDAIENAKRSMDIASQAVLKSYRLRTDVYRVNYPDRYMDERGEKMWRKLQDILQKISSQP
jgi:hypothetical protein